MSQDHSDKEDLKSEVYSPEPACEPGQEASPQPSRPNKGITFRGIGLAIILNIIYTLINAYMGLNFGIGLGFGIITVLTAYALFHIARGGSNRQEITTTTIASTGFSIYYTLSISIYIQAYVPDANLPWWLVPSQEVLLSGSPLHLSWLPPIIFHLGYVLLGTILAFILALTVNEMVLARKKAKFPFYLASGVTINTCLETGQQSRFMFRWLAIGILLTLIQYFINSLLLPFGWGAVSWDFTPYLPLGFALGFMLNIGIMAVSYIIDPKVSITMLVAGIMHYMVLSPILATFGFIPLPTPPITGMDLYFNLLFNFAISPALGIMLLSSIVVFGIGKLKKSLKKNEKAGNPKPEEEEEQGVGLIDLIREFIGGLRRNPKLLMGYVTIIGSFVIIVVVLNMFAPMPTWYSIPLALMFLIPIALIDVFVMIKFVGEAGIGMGAQRLAFYEIPLASIGVTGYTPFLTYPVINPWTATDTIGNLKIGQLTNTPRSSILIAQILKILPGGITSVIFVLAAWYFIGFPNEVFPGVGVLQGFAIVSLFATRAMGTSFNVWTFLAGGLLSGGLAAFFPIAPLGIALAMFLPPSWFIPFSLGGFLRLYTQKKYGIEWFGKRGQVIAIGFIAGATITQVIVSFLTSTQQLFILPICAFILFLVLYRYRRDPSPKSNAQPESPSKDEEAKIESNE